MHFPIKSATLEQRLLSILLVLAFLLIPFCSNAIQNIPSAGKRDPIIRVHLSRMNLTDRLHLELTVPYLLQAEPDTQILLRAESQPAFLLRNGTIYLHLDGITMPVGTSITLLRTAESQDGLAGFYRTNYPELYMGDLQIDVHEDKLRPILSIHVEDYLLGVVPYEMSESFPVEALKAQAVTARTYALKRQNPERSYDVVDTTNDQVFKGYLAGNQNTEQAIRETSGVCGFYRNQLAQCYYSASNGGQMELVQTVWPTREDFGYYSFGADPYDVENPESIVRSFSIKKKQPDHPGFVQLVLQELEDQLKETGVQPGPDMVRIERLTNIELLSPSKENSKLMNSIRLSLQLSARHQYTSVRIIDSDTEEVSLFSLTQQPSVSPTAAAPSPTPQPVYGPYQILPQEYYVDIPIFPTAEKVFGMDISSNFDNEIWSVVEEEQHFILEARRYGHGVGMSQRGAQWMAARYNRTYQDILSFYYPGMELKRYEDMPRRYTEVPEELAETAGPAPSPTPRPTVMPLTQKPEKGQWIAEVTEISRDSSLNLRTEPNLSSEIAMRLYYGQRLLVIEQCAEEGWLKVRTDVAEGYVMEKYLTRDD